MGYCGCMGYEALFPANQLGGLKNVWNLREYGVCEPWVTRESTVVTTSRPSKGLSIKALRIQSVPDNNLKSMRVNTEIIDGKKIVETKALIDSGTQGIFMDE